MENEKRDSAEEDCDADLSDEHEGGISGQGFSSHSGAKLLDKVTDLLSGVDINETSMSSLDNMLLIRHTHAVLPIICISTKSPPNFLTLEIF